MKRFACLLPMLLLGCGEPEVRHQLVISDVNLFDGTGESTRSVTYIAVDEGRISAIGEDGSVPDAESRIDLGGAFLMPGLIDTHVHLGFDFNESGMHFPKSESEYAAYVDGRMSDKLAGLLSSGFTTIMSPGDSWPLIMDVKTRQASGDIPGPRILVSGGIFTAPGGHPAVGICSGSDFCAEHVAIQVEDPEDARRWVRRYADSGVDQLKVTYVEPEGPKLDPEVAAAIVEEADLSGVRVLVHAMDAADVPQLVEWGVDGFVHPPGITPDNSGELLRNTAGLGVAITLGTIESAEAAWGPLDEASLAEFNATKANIERMIDAGAVPVFGSDMPEAPAAPVIDTVTAALSSVGLDNAAVLRAATRDAAQVLLGLGNVGSIEVGNVADMIVLDGDPLLDLGALHDIRYVVQAGHIVKSPD